MRLKKFKTFESDEYFGKTDRDIDLDDIESVDSISASTEEPTSEEDAANEHEYNNLHAAVEDLIDSTTEEQQVQKEKLTKKIADEGIDAGNLKSFTNENDVYDFYLEHRLEIDERLNDINFFEDAPTKYGSRSLYDYVVQGTKICVESLIVDMQ